jgi:hypothetical protein
LTGLGNVFRDTKTKAANRTLRIGGEIFIVRRHYSSRQNQVEEIAGKNWVELDIIFTTTKGTIQNGSTFL